MCMDRGGFGLVEKSLTGSDLRKTEEAHQANQSFDNKQGVIFLRYLIAFSSLVVALSGCSSVQMTQPQATISPLREENVKNYKIGTPAVATVGNPVIKRKNYFVRDITLHDRATPDRDFEVTCEIPLNSKINFQGVKQVEIPIVASTQINGGSYKVLNIGTTNNGLAAGILIDESSQAATGVGVWKNGFGSWITGMGATFKFSEPLPLFSFPTRHDVDKTRGFENVELIYTGVNGKNVNFLYREFTPDDLARPAFFQNVTYDISKSDVVAFKAFHMKIISASNTDLKYIVLADE